MRALLQSTVAEIPGLYGAFSFPEKLLQKIWLRGDFNRALARTADGAPLRIIHPGTWNLLGGPDFQRARFALGGEPERVADIEVHLRAGDWEAHGHAHDAAYDQVGLHVVLFPPEPGKVTRGADGREIPVVSLLSLLHHDLEEFAMEDAVEQLANRPAGRIVEELGRLGPSEAGELLQRHARARWEQKVRFARLRVVRLGWTAACHHAALEILGYRFNRSPMLRVAGRWPLWEWADESFDPEEAYAVEHDGWSLHGVRPLNHPRRRLRQYALWTRTVPEWPELLCDLGGAWPDVDARTETRRLRNRHRFALIRSEIGARVCGGAIGGCRIDNLICDGFLPLLASRNLGSLHGLWQHWFPGDLPPYVCSALRQLAFVRGRIPPYCHGMAQGLLDWSIVRGNWC